MKYGTVTSQGFLRAPEQLVINGTIWLPNSDMARLHGYYPVYADAPIEMPYYDVETKHELKEGYIREYYVGTLKPSAEVGQLGNDKAKALIAEKYSQSAENKLLRKAIADPKANAAEFAKYNAYVEQCIATADAEVEALLPVVESKPRKVEQLNV